MLSGYDTDVRAFWQPEFGPVCRACAVAKLGEPAVARLQCGLAEVISSPAGDWSRVFRHEVDDRAHDNGYEFGADCAEPGHAPYLRHGERFCEACAQECCWECGLRLDTSEAEDAAAGNAALARAGRTGQMRTR